MKKQPFIYGVSKVTLLVFLGFLLPGVLLAQESLTFVAERQTVAFGWGRNEFITVNPGDRIMNAEAGYGEAYRDSGEFHLLIIFGAEGDRFTSLARDFRPVYTTDTFAQDIFINYPMDRLNTESRQFPDTPITVGDADEMWIPVQYRDVLIGGNRDTLLEIFPALGFLSQSIPGAFIPWYENTQADIQHGRAMFYNSVIRLGTAMHFGVRDIRRTDFGSNFGYIVDCTLSASDTPHTPWPLFAGSAFWTVYRPGDEVTLLLYIDGDYLDVFTVGSNMHLGTFIRVGREFIAQYQSLVRANIRELSRQLLDETTNEMQTITVQWPRRADGSQEFPRLAGIPLSLPSHRSRVADLRLREHPTTASRIITTLDPGTAVQVLEIGHSSQIGVAIAPWVRVVCANGYTGWSFSGYLEITRRWWEPAPAAHAALTPGVVPSVLNQQSITLTSPAAIPANLPMVVPQTVAAHSNAAGANPMLFWAVIAAIAGWAIAMTVALLLFLAKRKR